MPKGAAARWNQKPAAAISPATPAHLMTFISAALLRRSWARPFDTHACHTASSSGFVAGGAHARRDSSNSTEVAMPQSSFFACLFDTGHTTPIGVGGPKGNGDQIA